jgi:glycerophosphoryl diester phosphodiesterase
MVVHSGKDTQRNPPQHSTGTVQDTVRITRPSSNREGNGNPEKFQEIGRRCGCYPDTSSPFRGEEIMKFIAHRGYSRIFHENTLPAFSAVIQHPCNGSSLIGIELDVHLCADDHIPIMHEVTIPAQNGKTVAVGSIPYRELIRLYRRHVNDPGVTVPDLDSVLTLVNHQTVLCLEIKEGPYDFERFLPLFMARIEAYAPDNDIIISTFSPWILRRVIGAASDLSCRFGFVFETWEQWDAFPKEMTDDIDYINPDYRLVLEKPEMIPHYGRPLQCWVVNEPDTVERLCSLPHAESIEAIMTDSIDLSYRYGRG